MPPRGKRKVKQAVDGSNDIVQKRRRVAGVGEESCGTSTSKEKKRRTTVVKKNAKTGTIATSEGPIRTVKCCLKKRLRKPNITLPKITTMVSHLSRMMRDGSMFINVCLLHFLQAGEGRLPGFFDFTCQTFFYRLMIAATGSFDCRDAHVKQQLISVKTAYPQLFANLNTVRLPGDDQVINQAVRGYITNFKNHHEVHRFARAKKYIRSRLGVVNWRSLSGSQKSSLCRFIYEVDASVVNVPDNVPCVAEAMEWIRELRSRYQEVSLIREERIAIRNSGMDKNGKKTAYEDIERRRWRALVEFTYWVGMRLHDHYVDTYSEAPVSSLRSKRRPKGKCVPRKGYHATHSIAPICDIRNTSITLTDTILRDCFKVPAESGDDPFRFLFKGVHNLKSSQKGWKLSSMTTDGVSLSVRFEMAKVAPHVELVDVCDCMECDDGYQDPVVPLHCKRVIAIDPGIINMMYGAEELPNGNFKGYSYPTKKYYHEAFVWKSRNLMKASTDRIQGVMDQLSACVKKTVLLKLQLEYWQVYVDNRDVLFDCLATKQRNKLAMNVYIHGNKSIDRFLNTFKDESGMPVEVGYGAGSMPNGMRGTLSPPTTRAYRRCCTMYPTIVVQEQYTSQKCPCCDEQLISPKELRMCNDGMHRMVDSRSVKRCTSPQCILRAEHHGNAHIRHVAITERAYEMSRDFVGARNILKCTLAIKEGRPRPAHLDWAHGD